MLVRTFFDVVSAVAVALLCGVTALQWIVRRNFNASPQVRLLHRAHGIRNPNQASVVRWWYVFAAAVGACWLLARWISS